ncbi:hypothetical protein [Streptomyces sp. NPDC048172]|uniref:hypothetical protein n=1 Tax=Streptomyces sp. NPDC048172 TaxID=3365505 RepID=UPI0037171A77
MRVRTAALTLAALAAAGNAAPAVAADQPTTNTGPCTVPADSGKEYKYTVDTCQFLGQFGLNSLVHGAVLGKEAPAEEPTA